MFAGLPNQSPPSTMGKPRLIFKFTKKINNISTEYRNNYFLRENAEDLT